MTTNNTSVQHELGIINSNLYAMSETLASIPDPEVSGTKLRATLGRTNMRLSHISRTLEDLVYVMGAMAESMGAYVGTLPSQREEN